MATQTSLIQLILNLLNNPQELAAFQQDPNAWLAACGAGDVTPADIHDALVLAQDDDRPQHHGDHQVPPPPHPEPGETPHEAAVRYLNTYVTNNYVDARETNVDNSLHQKVDTHGGDFDQDLDYHPVSATGDGAVAAGGDIRDSTVTTGNDNQVGSGNVKGDGNVVGHDNTAVTGDHDTASFGQGNATSTDIGGNVNVGAGAGFATGSGAVSVNNADSSQHDVGNVHTDNSAHNSGNDLSNNSVHDAGNTTLDQSEHGSHNSDTETHLDHVGNTDTDTSLHVTDHLPLA